MAQSTKWINGYPASMKKSDIVAVTRKIDLIRNRVWRVDNEKDYARRTEVICFNEIWCYAKNGPMGIIYKLA